MLLSRPSHCVVPNDKKYQCFSNVSKDAERITAFPPKLAQWLVPFVLSGH